MDFDVDYKQEIQPDVVGQKENSHRICPVMQHLCAAA